MPGRPPQVLVVMGVSGSGKSTVAALIAEKLGWIFVDGDSFHTPEHVAKMRAGHALDDADRAPWLARIAAWIQQRLDAGESGVVVCSALRRAYRDVLTRGSRRVRLVYLDGDKALIARRLAERQGHFMSPYLLDSQFATLEVPGPTSTRSPSGSSSRPRRLPTGSWRNSPPRRAGIRAGSDAMTAEAGKAAGIALVISDVDGTLVTGDKRLTAATVAAVRRLRAAGIGFSIASARPPIGLRSLVAELGLDLPMGAFNGASVVRPDLSIIEERTIPEAAARSALDRLLAEGLDVWVFADGAWCLRDPDGPYTDLERRTIGAEPWIVADLGTLTGSAAKIVGVSRDHAHLAACETRIAAALAGRATVHRSQAYYLDVTPPDLDKGRFVAWMSAHLAIPRERIATFGDAGNDRPMFAQSGYAVAMGNAEASVQAAASAVTDSNDADGFARAVERLILP